MKLAVLEVITFGGLGESEADAGTIDGAPINAALIMGDVNAFATSGGVAGGERQG